MPPMIPHSIRRLSLSFCLALALAAGGVAAPVQEAAAATATTLKQELPLPPEEIAEFADRISELLGLTGEKDRVIRRFYSDYINITLRNKSFIQRLENTGSKFERYQIGERWMVEHAKRNLYRLSYSDQRAFQAFLLAAAKATPTINACYGFLRSGKDFDSQALTREVYQSMPMKDFKNLLEMFLHAAALEDNERLPSGIDEETLQKAIFGLYSRIKTRIFRNYPKPIANELWDFQLHRKSQNKSVVCITDTIFYEEVLATQDTPARILMQYLANSISEPIIQNGYPF